MLHSQAMARRQIPWRPYIINWNSTSENRNQGLKPGLGETIYLRNLKNHIEMDDHTYILEVCQHLVRFFLLSFFFIREILL